MGEGEGYLIRGSPVNLLNISEVEGLGIRVSDPFRLFRLLVCVTVPLTSPATNRRFSSFFSNFASVTRSKEFADRGCYIRDRVMLHQECRDRE